MTSPFAASLICPLRITFIASYPNISIQAIEKKQGSFVIRLEVLPYADLSAIYSSAKELYRTQLAFMEQRYRAELQAKDGEIFAYKQQSANLMKITEILASKPMTSNINQTFNAQVGNAAGSNQGNMSAIQNSYGFREKDILSLLGALREQAENLADDYKDDTLDLLDDLDRSYALYKIDSMWIDQSKGFQRRHKNRHRKPCNVTIHMRFS